MFQTSKLGYSVLRGCYRSVVNAQQPQTLRYLHGGLIGTWIKADKPRCNRIPTNNVHQIRLESSSSSSPTPPDWKKLTNEDWAERLSREAYFVTREAGTEAPFSGQYVNHKAEGVYKCVCCGSELFTSKAKYDSGSGWPSFHSPAEDTRVIKRKDVSHGMVRIEVLCANCNSHLGHQFDDGPEPTGQRYCINSVGLKFNPKKIAN